jgi:hypothetical protein
MNTEVVPRAEFRVFGQGVIETVRGHMYNGKTVLQQARRMPAETYVVSAHTDDANVKLRDALLDIKLRVGLTPQGYDIYQPVAKLAFPLSAAQLVVVLSHLAVSTPPAQDTYSAKQFIALARAHPALRVATVEKMRYGFTIDAAICEYAQVWFNGALMETACAESEDHAGLEQVVAGLGLAGMPNTPYVRAAKQVLGLV